MKSSAVKPASPNPGDAPYGCPIAEKGTVGAVDRVGQLLTGPVACAFLLLVESNGLDADEAAAPPTAFALAAEAVHATNPWATEDMDAVIQELRARGERLRPLARELVGTPAAVWWWADLDRTAQHEPLWEPSDPSFPSPATFQTPTEPPITWERYAQKSQTGGWTSTAWDGYSALSVAIGRGVGDYMAGCTWTTLVPVVVAQEAPVIEVHGPDDWHELCVSHPAVDESGSPVASGGLVPDWSSVARVAAGVHLSFGGLLTTPWCSVTSDAGTTTMWAWHSEMTHWLHDVLTRGSPQPFDPDEHVGPDVQHLSVEAQH